MFFLSLVGTKKQDFLRSLGRARRMRIRPSTSGTESCYARSSLNSEVNQCPHRHAPVLTIELIVARLIPFVAANAISAQTSSASKKTVCLSMKSLPRKEIEFRIIPVPGIRLPAGSRLRQMLRLTMRPIDASWYLSRSLQRQPARQILVASKLRR